MGKKTENLKDGFSYLSIWVAGSQKELDCIEKALSCLTLVENAWVLTNVRIYCASPVLGSFLPEKSLRSKKHLIVLSPTAFDRDSMRNCILLVLHELAHALVEAKMLKVPRKKNEEQVCNEFAKQRLKFRAEFLKQLDKSVRGS